MLCMDGYADWANSWADSFLGEMTKKMQNERCGACPKTKLSVMQYCVSVVQMEKFMGYSGLAIVYRARQNNQILPCLHA